jgi:hypothetical protein
VKYEIYHEIDANIDDLVKLTQLREDRDPRVYPNVTSTKLIKEERKGSKLLTVLETCANGDIPPKLRKLIKPEMLSWHEYGEFDFDTNEYRYKVKTFYLSNVFKMQGKVQWTRLGENKSGRKMTVEIDIKVPILGRMAEKKISETQIENLDLDPGRMPLEVEEAKKQGTI